MLIVGDSSLGQNIDQNLVDSSNQNGKKLAVDLEFMNSWELVLTRVEYNGGDGAKLFRWSL